MNVHILVTANDPVRLRAQTLCAETIRVGFPTANIYVYDNASTVYGWYERFEQARVALTLIPSRVHHAKWIRDVFESELETNTKFAIVDADTVFWRDCEWFEFLEPWAGHYVPAMWNDFSNTPSVSRLHTSFMWFQDPKGVQKLIREAVPNADDYCRFEPFMPMVSFMQGNPVFYDSCANLYQAVGGGMFQADHLACYDHVNSVSFYETMLGRLPNPEEFAKLHKLANEEPEKLKGIHMEIANYYDSCVRRLQDYLS